MNRPVEIGVKTVYWLLILSLLSLSNLIFVCVVIKISAKHIVTQVENFKVCFVFVASNDWIPGSGTWYHEYGYQFIW